MNIDDLTIREARNRNNVRKNPTRRPEPSAPQAGAPCS